MTVIFKSVADLQLKDSFWINVKPLMVGFGFNFLLLWKSYSKAEEKYFKIKYWFSLSSNWIKKASENQLLSNLIIGVSLSSERQRQAMLKAKSMIRCTHGLFQSGISSTLNNFTMRNRRCTYLMHLICKHCCSSTLWAFNAAKQRSLKTKVECNQLRKGVKY